jgi:2-methylcitrate dehydratase PrpD
VLEGLGERWEILENGFKYFPSILASHSAIQATLRLVTKHRIDPRRIVRITNETYQTVASHFSNTDVRTPMAARVSVPYCIAVAAVDGTVTQAQFAGERIEDPLVRHVLGITEVIPDAALTELYPDKFPARVAITLDDGSTAQETVLFPKGDPQDPLSSEELEEKFVENVRGQLGYAEAQALIDAINSLPEAEDAEEVALLLDAASIPGRPADVR